MKTRDGFVSNSSSSSFVVVFGSKSPSDQEIMRTFGVVSWYPEYIHGEEMGILIRDTHAQEPLEISPENRDALVAKFFQDESMYYEVCYHTPEGKRLNQERNNPWEPGISPEEHTARVAKESEIWKQLDDLAKTKLDQKIDEWISLNRDQWAFGYSYSDNEGQGALEHGSHWENADAWVFSHH